MSIKSAVTISLVKEAEGGPFVFWHDLAAGCAKGDEAVEGAARCLLPSYFRHEASEGHDAFARVDRSFATSVMS